MPTYKKPSHIHVVPLPDQYRGQHHYSDEEASVKYAEAVKSRLAKLEDEGRRLAAFICEPYFVESGVHPPTSQYYQEVYSAVRAHGGLVIADEVKHNNLFSCLFFKFTLRVELVLGGLESTCGASKALESFRI